MKNKKNKTLKIQADQGQGIRTLYPGDTYILTADIHGSSPGLTGSAVIRITYIWDGETLLRKTW